MLSNLLLDLLLNLLSNLLNLLLNLLFLVWGAAGIIYFFKCFIYIFHFSFSMFYLIESRLGGSTAALFLL